MLCTCCVLALPMLHGTHDVPFHQCAAALVAPASMLHCLQLHTTPAKSREYGGFREGIFYAFEKVVKQHGAALAYPTHVSDCHICTMQLLEPVRALQGCCHTAFVSSAEQVAPVPLQISKRILYSECVLNLDAFAGECGPSADTRGRRRLQSLVWEWGWTERQSSHVHEPRLGQLIFSFSDE